MRLLMILSVAAAWMTANNAMGVEMPLLAKKNNCTACHAIDRKVLGPAWMDVAKKYKGDKGAEARLVAKVEKGGSGVWGPLAMPPQPAVKDADARELVKFILSLAK